MGGGVAWPPARWAIHRAHSSHQVSACLVAAACHSSGSEAGLSLVQWTAVLLGGLTMPAMCPELLSTNFTFPPQSWVVLKDDRQGAMWSSTAARTKTSCFTFEGRSFFPAIIISPLASRFSW